MKVQCLGLFLFVKKITVFAFLSSAFLCSVLYNSLPLLNCLFKKQNCLEFLFINFYLDCLADRTLLKVSAMLVSCFLL